MSSLPLPSHEDRNLYRECIEKQLEEIQLLSSIYYAPGELEILDPACICDFEQFLQDSQKDESISSSLRSHLEFTVRLEVPTKGETKEKLDLRIELPYLYPNLEHPNVSLHHPLISKNKASLDLESKIKSFLEKVDKQSPYIFQLISWIQEEIEDIFQNIAKDSDHSKVDLKDDPERLIDFERLWIYSHHIKSKTKRQEIVRQSRDLDLSGFSRPGKPGIICVEGLSEHTQEFWRIIKSLHWQKISICKSEKKRIELGKLNDSRRFNGFKEQLFCIDEENEDVVMNMGLFIKFLEDHNSAYMKKELFGFE